MGPEIREGGGEVSSARVFVLPAIEPQGVGYGVIVEGIPIPLVVVGEKDGSGYQIEQEINDYPLLFQGPRPVYHHRREDEGDRERLSGPLGQVSQAGAEAGRRPATPPREAPDGVVPTGEEQQDEQRLAYRPRGFAYEFLVDAEEEGGQERHIIAIQAPR